LRLSDGCCCCCCCCWFGFSFLSRGFNILVTFSAGPWGGGRWACRRGDARGGTGGVTNMAQQVLWQKVEADFYYFSFFLVFFFYFISLFFFCSSALMSNEFFTVCGADDNGQKFVVVASVAIVHSGVNN